MKDHLFILYLGCSISTSISSSIFAAGVSKPSIVVIVADDLGYADVVLNAVHAPLQAPSEEIAKFKTDDADRNVLLTRYSSNSSCCGRWFVNR